ncbi:MAG TPA: hypothetical protein VH138_05085, partial [Vicinamibacterales bacterium]|nr:hypothetical protein [Vicinamibacterales bacterium]
MLNAAAESCVSGVTDRPRSSIDVTHTTLSVLVLLLLGAAAFWVLRPFLTSIIWATIVSVAGWPLLLRLDARLGRRRGLAVTIITVTILLVVFVPMTLAIVTIVKNARGITAEIRSLDAIPIPAPPAVLERLPIVG